MRKGKPNRNPIRVAAVLVAIALCNGCVAPGIPEPEKPIIANLYADAAKYDGQQVTIYGLVIEAEKNGRQFMLQDVSQMPLKILKPDGLPVVVGDQILIEGVFRASRGDPYIEARQVTYTKVLGGGGCC
jgi:hypothetical protein